MGKTSIFKKLRDFGLFNLMPDKQYLKMNYRLYTGEKLNLNNPTTINEKIQWLKLYDRNPLYTQLVDKYEAKSFIRQVLGQEYVVPTIGVWNKFDDIDFEKFPNEFVLKCTHDSGSIVVVRDKTVFDRAAARKVLERGLSGNYYYVGREWPYKNVRPRIIAEPLLKNSDHSRLLEYEFFCFNGEPKIILRGSGDRDKGEQRYSDYYEIDGTKLPFKWGYPYSDAKLEITDVYNDMVEKARILSKNIPFVRVDMYACDGKALIGEMTLFHWCGFMPLEPKEWDLKIGDMLDLSSVSGKC